MIMMLCIFNYLFVICFRHIFQLLTVNLNSRGFSSCSYCYCYLLCCSISWADQAWFKMVALYPKGVPLWILGHATMSYLVPLSFVALLECLPRLPSLTSGAFGDIIWNFNPCCQEVHAMLYLSIDSFTFPLINALNICVLNYWGYDLWAWF